MWIPDSPCFWSPLVLGTPQFNKGRWSIFWFSAPPPDLVPKSCLLFLWLPPRSCMPPAVITDFFSLLWCHRLLLTRPFAVQEPRISTMQLFFRKPPSLVGVPGNNSWTDPRKHLSLPVFVWWWNLVAIDVWSTCMYLFQHIPQRVRPYFQRSKDVD